MLRRIVAVANYVFAASIPFTHIGGYVAAAGGMAGLRRSWGALKKDPVAIWLAMFVAYGMALSAFSGEPSVGYRTVFGYAAHWLLPFVLGYSLGANSVARVFAVFYGIFSLLAFISVLAYFGLFVPRFGTDFHLVQEGLLKGLRSHIAFAALSLVLSFFALASFVTAGDRRRKTLSALFALFFAGVVLLTGSRGYYIAAALAYGAFGVSRLIVHRSFGRLLAGGALLAALAVSLYALSPDIRERIRRTGPSDINVQERLSLYTVALWEIGTRPLFGYGPGQGVRQDEFFSRLPEHERSVRRHPHLHSFYLNLAADFGVTGLALFVVLMVTILRKLRAPAAAGDGTDAALSLGLFWGIIGILAGELFDTLLRGPGTAMELFWLAGLVLGGKIPRQSGGEK